MAGFEVALLREIPRAADPDGHDGAESRLYPGLFIDPGDRGGDDDEGDWDEIVHPSLRAAFEGALEVVDRDMSGAEPVDGEDGAETLWDVSIPTDHAEAWLSSLNQARLSLAERFDLYDEHGEMLGGMVDFPTGEGEQRRWRAAVQSDLYGYLMEWILAHVIGA